MPPQTPSEMQVYPVFSYPDCDRPSFRRKSLWSPRCDVIWREQPRIVATSTRFVGKSAAFPEVCVEVLVAVICQPSFVGSSAVICREVSRELWGSQP